MRRPAIRNEADSLSAGRMVEDKARKQECARDLPPFERQCAERGHADCSGNETRCSRSRSHEGTCNRGSWCVVCEGRDHQRYWPPRPDIPCEGHVGLGGANLKTPQNSEMVAYTWLRVHARPESQLGRHCPAGEREDMAPWPMQGTGVTRRSQLEAVNVLMVYSYLPQL